MPSGVLTAIPPLNSLAVSSNILNAISIEVPPCFSGISSKGFPDVLPKFIAGFLPKILAKFTQKCVRNFFLEHFGDGCSTISPEILARFMQKSSQRFLTVFSGIFLSSLQDFSRIFTLDFSMKCVWIVDFVKTFPHFPSFPLNYVD